MHVQVHLSWAETQDEVEAQALDQWRINALPPNLNEELELPAQFDAARFNWLGSMNDEVSVCVAWHTSGIATLEQVKQRELTVGGTGPAVEHADRHAGGSGHLCDAAAHGAGPDNTQGQVATVDVNHFWNPPKVSAG